MKSTIFYLIITVILILGYTTYIAQKRSNEMLERYKKEEIYKVEHNLKNFVDVAYSTIDSNYKNSMDKEYLEKHYGYRLKNIIDVVETILKSKTEEVRKGKLTRVEAQKKATEEIQKIRYNEGKGYIWITNTDLPYPRMIMHPTMSSLNDQTMNDPKYNCAKGKKQNLFVAFVEVVQKQGGGFVDYLWPKSIKEDLTIDVPKLSYVRHFPAWDWIIGTDFYIDDAILDGMEKSKEELRQMRYDNGIGFFWINNMDESSPQFYMYPIAVSIENTVLAGGSLDKLGTVIKKFIKTCKEFGKGYVTYKWDKPTLTGSVEDVEKLSYVKLYEPLGWIIGTGVYMDDIDKFIVKERKFLNKQIWKLITNISIISLIFIILVAILRYFVTKYLSKIDLRSILFAESIVPQKNEKPQPIVKQPLLLKKAESAVPKTTTANNDLKTVLDISKIMLAQSKLLAFTATLQATQEESLADKSKTTKEMEKIANQVHDIVEDIQERIDTKIP
ncbi:cache domain-containing protein [Candidatus Parabeggiatoa sp. HSG14]|uniref:cache domain-containing protein n=1 Tax=Candidatus Parabeggiatoa sp. HSG14 TaxID=3055593 RepID=UPI0025A81619|nr:cache domain-containing protein [Thiotrichales bacterium HSG14]